MKQILQWLRDRFSSKRELTTFELEHYSKFEIALMECDLEVYVYEEHGVKGRLIVLKGDDLHQVTAENLVSFRKLNRQQRRLLDNKYGAKLARETNEKYNKHLYR